MLSIKLQFYWLHCGIGWVTWLNFKGICFGIASIKRTFNFDGEEFLKIKNLMEKMLVIQNFQEVKLIIIMLNSFANKTNQCLNDLNNAQIDA